MGLRRELFPADRAVVIRIGVPFIAEEHWPANKAYQTLHHAGAQGKHPVKVIEKNTLGNTYPSSPEPISRTSVLTTFRQYGQSTFTLRAGTFSSGVTNTGPASGTGCCGGSYCGGACILERVNDKRPICG